MSLYNMVHGFDDNAGAVLHSLGLKPSDIPRFRDAYPDPEKKVLIILTRTGGGNRDDYQEENDSLVAHPLYIRDYDDEFDSTFALFEFQIPEGTVLPEGLEAPLSLEEKTHRVVERMKGGRQEGS